MIWWIRNWFRERRIRKNFYRNIMEIERHVQKETGKSMFGKDS